MSLNSILFIFLVLISCSYNIFVAGGSYCLFLVMLSLISSSLLYINSLSFWYCIIMLLIYVGGVYILLLFVSIYSYNSFSYSNFLSSLVYLLFFTSSILLSDSEWSTEYWFNIVNFSIISDESNMLITSNNWVSFIFILLVIILSLIIFSFIFSQNSSYVR
uniref:NADH dehydrogenase subunit 6 n=1 Tax=Gyrodactylus kobayashii TaxID=89149 RepID=A0A166A4E5_9PLAT|nr:NADH dehydrogenase subunit 6 [Gyrodactylus kobayashii]AMZ79736.1 NADH dehydrogenase subunit 6 [Gyrodactylus kobayashii]